MPLTLVDIRNVAFGKPPIGKRGYNEEEVDAFLDLVGSRAHSSRRQHAAHSGNPPYETR